MQLKECGQQQKVINAQKIMQTGKVKVAFAATYCSKLVYGDLNGIASKFDLT